MESAQSHHRTASNSYRIAMSHPPVSSSSSSISTAAIAGPSHANVVPIHPPSPSRTRGPRSPRYGKRTSTLERLRITFIDWLNGRMISRRSGPRRWIVVLGILALYLMRRQFYSSAGDAPASWSLLGSNSLDTNPPLINREALEKLRLLEIHFGADEEAEPEHELAAPPVPLPRRPAVQPKPAADELPERRVEEDEHPEEAVPLVAAIPDWTPPNPAVPTPLARAPARVVDAEMCPERGGEPCQFLLAAWLGEQETKAQLHIYQLGLLAVALNRTLVVPNVAKSRLSTCNPSPFGFYYGDHALSRMNIPTITQGELVEWAERRDPPATGQVVSLVKAMMTYPSGAIEIDSALDPQSVPNNPKRNLCLRPPRSRIDFTGHSPLSIYPPEAYHKTEKSRAAFGESVVNTLRSEEVGSRSSRASASRNAAYSLPNVLAFNYELRYPMLSPAVAASFNPDAERVKPFEHFPYADVWTEYADTIITNLSPFIAIHWRTETLTPENLAPCATSLIRKLAALKAQHPSIRNVYLATDYPIEALENGGVGVPHSGTFAKVVTEQHHNVFRKFLRDFARALPDLRLTTFAKEQELVSLPDNLDELISDGARKQILKEHEGIMPAKLKVEEIDSGLYGILDKAIATRAEVFVTGTVGLTSVTVQDACAKLSSFTSQLIAAREGLRAEQEEDKGEDGEEEGEPRRGTLWNEVEYFSLKKGL